MRGPSGNDPRSSLSAGILAGGEGRRFAGADKGWIEVGGTPLVVRVLEAMRPQVDEVLISANRNLERYAALPDVRVVADEDGGERQGPFAGLVRLLGASTRAWVVFVPCDIGWVPEDYATRLLDCVRRAGADAAALHDGTHLHPLCSIVRTALAAEAAAAFAGGERMPRAWLERQRLALLTGPAPLNGNSPEALASWTPQPFA